MEATQSLPRSNSPIPLAETMLLGVAIVWGASYGLAKGAVAYYPVLGFLAIRFCLTSAILAPALRGMSRAHIRDCLAPGIPLGGILLAIFVCETFGVALTRASNAAFLIGLCVVFTPFVEWAVLGARPGKKSLLAIAISVMGAWLLTGGVHIDLNPGDGLILLAALLRAIMVTATSKLTKDRNVAALPLTAVQTGTVGLGSLALFLSTVSPAGWPVPTAPGFWYATMFMVFFCTIFAFFAQNYALRRASPTRVSLLMGTEPVFGALFAVFRFGEHLSLLSWMGGLMIVAASLWATMRRT